LELELELLRATCYVLCSGLEGDAYSS
jgi:hypothetical protein